MKLKALIISHPLTKDVTDMKWLQEIEEQANVEIEWEQIRADWETVKSTRFAAGDIPDLLFNATVDSDYTKYNGLFMDLTPYISEETTPNITAMFTEEPDAYFAEDSQVKNYAVDERYKLFMKYIADLYADGLINQNALTNDYSAFQSLSAGITGGKWVGLKYFRQYFESLMFIT